MQKRIVLSLIILIAAVFGVFVGYEVKTGKWNIKNPFQSTNAVSVSISSINQQDNFFNIKVEYPQFKFNGSTNLNKEISDLVNNKISQFKKDSQDNWTARRATATPDNPVPENPEAPFDFIVTWTPTQLNNNYLSFYIDIYYFTGGAHGASEIDAFNYDIAKKKEITISDFLNNSPDALQKLSVLTAQNVNSQLTSTEMQINDSLQQMITDGTAPTLDNYKNFNFNYNSLLIYFQQYQVAPGSSGQIKIKLYKPDLEQNFIKTNYLW